MTQAPSPFAARVTRLAPALALALCACGTDTAGEAPRPAPVASPAPSSKPAMPAATPIGEAQNCLNLRAFSSTRIRDDSTIDFLSGAGGKVWRVTLPRRCPGLRSADSFTYETSLSQLCSTDIVYPLMRYGNRFERGAGCGLGPFTPVTLAK